jgi:hypothetical protein
LATPNSGVAWTGPNAKSAAVGVTWARVDNPNPDREVTAVEVSAAPTGGVYVLAGLTVSEQPRPVPASDASFGGPDNWANASCVYALMEGLVGVVDTKPAYAVAQVAPRWAFAGVRRAQATVTYPASGGYVAYDYSLRKGGRLVLRIATSGNKVQLHLPLPAGIKRPELRVNGKVVPSKVVRVEGTKYVDANVVARGALSVVLQPATKARADFGLFRVLGLGGFLRRKIVNQGVNQIARARLAWP